MARLSPLLLLLALAATTATAVVDTHASFCHNIYSDQQVDKKDHKEKTGQRNQIGVVVGVLGRQKERDTRQGGRRVEGSRDKGMCVRRSERGGREGSVLY